LIGQSFGRERSFGARESQESNELRNYLRVLFAAIVVGGCSTVGQLTVNDYQAKSGQRVMAGRAEPKAEYKCTILAQVKQD